MKFKTGSIIIGLLLAALATLLLIVLPSSGNLWVAYAFCLIGIAMTVVGAFFLNTRNVPASYALLLKSGRFLPCSLLVSAIVLALQGLTDFTMPVVLHAVVQTILAIVFGVQLIGIQMGKARIDNVDRRTNAQVERMSSLAAEVNALLPRADALPEDKRPAAKKALKQLNDALRYSDPMTTERAREKDEQIQQGISQLAKLMNGGSAETIISTCQDLVNAVRARNELVKITKQSRSA